MTSQDVLDAHDLPNVDYHLIKDSAYGGGMYAGVRKGYADMMDYNKKAGILSIEKEGGRMKKHKKEKEGKGGKMMTRAELEKRLRF